ncbi:Dedicator of cytokinesis like protein, partial [Aduncisulcus paluster]
EEEEEERRDGSGDSLRSSKEKNTIPNAEKYPELAELTEKEKVKDWVQVRNEVEEQCRMLLYICVWIVRFADNVDVDIICSSEVMLYGLLDVLPCVCVVCGISGLQKAQKVFSRKVVSKELVKTLKTVHSNSSHERKRIKSDSLFIGGSKEDEGVGMYFVVWKRKLFSQEVCIIVVRLLRMLCAVRMSQLKSRQISKFSDKIFITLHTLLSIKFPLRATLRVLQVCVELFTHTHKLLFGKYHSTSAKIIQELTSLCTNSIPCIRLNATSVLFFLLRCAFFTESFCGVNDAFTRTAMDVTVSVSRCISQICLDINKVRNLQASMAHVQNLRQRMATFDTDSEAFCESIRTLFDKRLQTIMKAVLKMTGGLTSEQNILCSYEADTMLLLRQSMADAFSNVPVLRFTWLNNLAVAYEEVEHFGELGMVKISIASLISEFIVVDKTVEDVIYERIGIRSVDNDGEGDTTQHSKHASAGSISASQSFSFDNSSSEVKRSSSSTPSKRDPGKFTLSHALLPSLQRILYSLTKQCPHASAKNLLVNSNKKTHVPRFVCTSSSLTPSVSTIRDMRKTHKRTPSFVTGGLNSQSFSIGKTDVFNHHELFNALISADAAFAKAKFPELCVLVCESAMIATERLKLTKKTKEWAQKKYERIQQTLRFKKMGVSLKAPKIMFYHVVVYGSDLDEFSVGEFIIRENVIISVMREKLKKWGERRGRVNFILKSAHISVADIDPNKVTIQLSSVDPLYPPFHSLETAKPVPLFAPLSSNHLAEALEEGVREQTTSEVKRVDPKKDNSSILGSKPSHQEFHDHKDAQRSAFYDNMESKIVNPRTSRFLKSVGVRYFMCKRALAKDWIDGLEGVANDVHRNCAFYDNMESKIVNPRTSRFLKSVGVGYFMCKRALAKDWIDGLEGVANDVHRNWSVLCIYEVAHPFPYTLPQQRVIRRYEQLLNPLKTAIEDIRTQVSRCKNVAMISEIDTIQHALQGALLTSVNVGPKVLIKAFLTEGNRNKLVEAGYKDDVEEFASCCCAFMYYADIGVRNGMDILNKEKSEEKKPLQKQLKIGQHDLLFEISEILGIKTDVIMEIGRSYDVSIL